MSSVADLWALQTVDLVVEEFKARLGELEKQQSDTAAVAAARAAAGDAEREVARVQATQKDLERQIKELATHAQEVEREMMSGRVRNPRELEGLQANAEALQRRRAALEDQSLQTMLELEQWQTENIRRQEQRQHSEAEYRSRQETIRQQAAQLIGDLKVQSARLKELWSATPPADRELYKNLRTRKAGRAVARAQNGSCTACGVMLPTGAVQALNNVSQRVTCPSCGRLLWAG